jgi:hypothetical protein
MAIVVEQLVAGETEALGDNLSQYRSVHIRP